MIETPVPIVLWVPEKCRPPRSDNAMNAICAAKVAISDIAEVVVVMRDSSDDSVRSTAEQK
jgi:glutamyl-tRNA(Gln) amidotransferase subunit D